MLKTTCPECDRLIKVRPHLRQGEHLRCRHCQTTLAVVEVSPLELEALLSSDPKRNRKAKTMSRQRNREREMAW